MDYIIRKTWGFGKKEDQIPLSQFREAVGMTKTHVANSLAKLKKMNLIFITEKNNYKGNLYKFNKDFDTWNPLPKKGTPQSYPNTGIPHTRKQVQGVPEYGNKSYPNTGTSITNKTIIKTTLKNNGATPPSKTGKVDNRKPEIQELWEFGVKQGFSNTKQNLNRFAIKRLLNGRNVLQLKQICHFSQFIKQQPYAPKIYNWMDLEEKYLKLKDFFDRKKSEKTESKGLHL